MEDSAPAIDATRRRIRGDVVAILATGLSFGEPSLRLQINLFKTIAICTADHFLP